MLTINNIDAAKAKMDLDNKTFAELAAKFKTEAKESAERVVLSLHNADTVGMLLCVYQENAKGVMVGAKAVKNAIGAKSILVILPEGKENFESFINDGAAFVDEKVEFVYGTCIKREYENDLLIHPVTCAKIAASLAGEDTDGYIVCVDKKVPFVVKFGTKLSEIAGSDFKAVRIGNRLLGNAHKDAVIDADFPIENGVIETVSDEECVVKLTSEIIHDLRLRSCGRCVYCREGLAQIDTVLNDITLSRGRANDLEFMEEIVNAMHKYSNCTFGQTAGGSVTGLLSEFMDETKEHMQKKCRTLKCASMLHYYIDQSLCKGDANCNAVCKYAAINGGKDFINVIDDFDCKKCGECVTACAQGAIKVVSGTMPKVPDKPIPLKEGLVAASGDGEITQAPTGKKPRRRR